MDSAALGLGPLAEVLRVLLFEGEQRLASDFGTEEARSLYAAAAASEPDTIKDPAALVGLRLNRLKKESLRAEAANLKIQLQEAERSQDTARMVELLQKKVQVGQALERVGAS